MKRVSVIGAISCRGAQDFRCAAGPVALRRQALQPRLQAAGLDVQWHDVHAGDQPAEALDVIVPVCAEIYRQVIAARRAGRLPLVIGGDHSCAVGTWSGIWHDLGDRGPLGLVWVDAHMDSHTPQTSHSHAVHGMPLAALLGYGDARLTGLGAAEPKLLPEHVALVGVRSYEPEEAELLERLGVRVYFMPEIRRRGLREVFAEACAIAKHGTAGYGISIDLDAVDPGDAPGVGSPVLGGIFGWALCEALKLVQDDIGLLGLEIMEYNPARDRGKRTARLAEALIHAALGDASDDFCERFANEDD